MSLLSSNHPSFSQLTSTVFSFSHVILACLIISFYFLSTHPLELLYSLLCSFSFLTSHRSSFPTCDTLQHFFFRCRQQTFSWEVGFLHGPQRCTQQNISHARCEGRCAQRARSQSSTTTTVSSKRFRMACHLSMLRPMMRRTKPCVNGTSISLSFLAAPGKRQCASRTHGLLSVEALASKRKIDGHAWIDLGGLQWRTGVRIVGSRSRCCGCSSISDDVVMHVVEETCSRARL